MSTLINNGTIINEGLSYKGSLLLVDERIKRIIPAGDSLPDAEIIIDAEGMYIVPGIIDDQVHFREPGNTHKGTIESESAAAVLGGVTSYMDMPNNNPATTTVELLEAKNDLASRDSYANWSFYMGATNSNIDQLKQINPSRTCGIKVFMGSSTGNMLVDNPAMLDTIFKECRILIATHCEDEPIIQENLRIAREKYHDNIPFSEHPYIRSREACIKSTKKAVELAVRHNSRLHILHISTEEEIEIIKEASLRNPGITGEICVHYMLFDKSDYDEYGSLMKCNPAIKDERDKKAIIQAVKDGIIKVVATDHAPHTIEEKSGDYLKAPSGLPLIQHSFQIMWDLHKAGHFSEYDVVDRLSHSPAANFKIVERGYIREGYYADIMIFDPNIEDKNTTQNPAYKCGWSPFRDRSFSSSIIHTFVNGKHIVENGKLTGEKGGKRLEFNYGK
ncbi:Allantoinase [Bacteroidales bacterium CF]|jgi:Dihydroorotase and related cyclic amidohydrolases|nr:Allantoinase [Bacteroidales bacterium CF]NCB97791.1 dihydroorotase [Bacteroidia bacterium]